MSVEIVEDTTSKLHVSQNNAYIITIVQRFHGREQTQYGTGVDRINTGTVHCTLLFDC